MLKLTGIYDSVVKAIFAMVAILVNDLAPAIKQPL
jgi:hypothetical protein